MKLNFNLNLKFNFNQASNIRLITKIVLGLVILIELYLSYSYLITNLNPQPGPIGGARIVRVDRAALSAATQFFQNLYLYSPPIPTLSNSNPFKYAP